MDIASHLFNCGSAGSINIRTHMFSKSETIVGVKDEDTRGVSAGSAGLEPD